MYGPGSGKGNQINPFYVAVPGSTTGVETVRIDFNQILGPGAFTKSGTSVVYATPGADIKLGGDWIASIETMFGATSSFSHTIGQVCASCAYLALNGTTNSGGSLTTSSIPAVLGTTDITTPVAHHRERAQCLGRAGFDGCRRRQYQRRGAAAADGQ